MCQSFLVEIVKHFCTSKELPYPPPGLVPVSSRRPTTFSAPSATSLTLLASTTSSQVKPFRPSLYQGTGKGHEKLPQNLAFLNAVSPQRLGPLGQQQPQPPSGLSVLLFPLRAFDTLHFVYVGFDGHKDFPLYRRIQTYRLYLMNHVLREYFFLTQNSGAKSVISFIFVHH